MRNRAPHVVWMTSLLLTGGLDLMADAASLALDPFAPTEERDAAVREILARPTRFSLETHTLKPSAEAKPRTLTFRLNTVSGEVCLFNGKAFVDVSDGSSANPELLIDLAASPTPEEAAARRRMEAILLPEVSFRETRVEDAMQFLQDASKEHDPEKKGFVFVNFSDDARTDGTAARTENTSKCLSLPISFTARSVSLLDVVGVVATYTGLEWKPRDGTILWAKGKLPSPVQTRTFWVTDATVRWLDRECKLPPGSAGAVKEAVADAEGQSTKPRSGIAGLLERLGVPWTNESSAVIRPDISAVTITASMDALGAVKDLLANLDRSTSAPGRYSLRIVETEDGASRLLLVDSETGRVWEYRTDGTSAATATDNAPGRFVPVEEHPRGER